VEVTPSRDALRVVALGGGHGAAQSIRAAKRYAAEITAVISVADDGGSSGRLRRQLGIPAPGDLRRCIGALLPEGSLLVATLEHRFDQGELEGHAFGNLLIAALTATTGDFTAGVAEAARLFGAEGKVYPATSVPVALNGRGKLGEVSGQVRIKSEGGVSTVEIVPADAPAPAEAVAAILEADQVIIGPGSLYTSLLAVAVVPMLRVAISATPAQVVYVANLREQAPETAGFDVADHVRALMDHGIRIDVVLADEDALRVGTLPSGVVLRRGRLATRDKTAHVPEALGDNLAAVMLAKGRQAGEK
jgi:uncharacterized cofD-like protein